MKKLIKLYLSILFYYSGLFRLFRLYNNIAGKKLTILTFHRVTNNDNGPQIKGLPTISIAIDNFRSLLQFLKKYYNIISVQDYLQSVKNGIKFSNNCLILSFDDGYKEVLANALPVLNEFEAPSILFVPTMVLDAVADTGLFWWDVLYLLLSNNNNIKFKQKNNVDTSIKQFLQRMEEISSETPNDKDVAIYGFIESLQKAPKNIRLAIVRYILHTYQSLQQNLVQLPRAMLSDGIETLYEAGVEIGSHTVSHRFLSTLPDAEVMIEITESKKKLENFLNNEVSCFSYPGGKYTVKIVEMVKEAEYQCAFTTDIGLNSYDNDPYKLKRINIWDGTVANVKGKFSKSLTAWNLFLKK